MDAVHLRTLKKWCSDKNDELMSANKISPHESKISEYYVQNVHLT